MAVRHIIKTAIALTILTMQIFVVSCSAIQSLRKEAYEDEQTEEEADAHRYANRNKNSLKRKPLPAPVTVLDRNLSEVQGSPIDLSGVRAKTGRVTRQDFDNLTAGNENSLWKEDGQNNFYFATNKQRVLGDLITLDLEKSVKKDLVKEYSRTIPEEDRQDLRLPGLIKEREPSRATASGIDKPNEAPASAASADATNAATPAAATAEANASGAGYQEPIISDEPLQMTAEVMQRYPNGNLLVRGVKRIPYRNQARTLEVTAIIRGSDIGEDGTVKSSKFFESKVEAYR